LRNKIGEELCDDLEAAIRAEITLATGAVNLLIKEILKSRSLKLQIKQLKIWQY
jgi:hypothetical protein